MTYILLEDEEVPLCIKEGCDEPWEGNMHGWCEKCYMAWSRSYFEAYAKRREEE